MAKSRVLTGPRAILFIGSQKVGMFTNVTWSIRQEKIPTFTLGRFNPQEVVTTAQEAVQMSLSGYRVVGAGPYKVLHASMLKDLLNENDFNISIVDRGSDSGNNTIFMAKGCRVTGWSSGVAARTISDVRCDVVGLIGEDEEGIARGGDDDTGASNIGDGA